MRNNIKNLAFFMLFVAVGFMACEKETGSGDEVRETRSIAAFTEVEMQNSADVEFIKGTTQKVEVSDFENLLEFLIVEVSGNKLIIKTKANTVVSNSRAKVFITTPETITKTVLSGSGNIVFKDAMSSLKTAEISGSGNITSSLSTTYTNLDLIVSGSGNINFNGKATDAKAVVSGSGKINLGDLESQNADALVSGSGDITVKAVKKLDAAISGSGNIFYFGTPDLKTNITGSGKVVKK